MADPIDLNAERNKREQPNSEFVRADDYGRPLHLFTLSYEMDDKKWGTDVWAYNLEDADNRVAAMRESLVLDGQVYERIPV